LLSRRCRRVPPPAQGAERKQPKSPSLSQRAGLDGVVDSLLFAQHAIEMFRRSLPDTAAKHRLDQLANRLAKILAETHQLKPEA
jgi:hypothetical protein